MDKNSGRVFVICGDGECNEGSVWEALMFASSHKLNNFVFIVDYNKFQGFGATNDVIDQSNIAERVRAFGFDTLVIDGNNLDELKRALTHKVINRLQLLQIQLREKEYHSWKIGLNGTINHLMMNS